MVLTATLMLPKAVEFTNVYSQVAFGGSVLFMKYLAYFQMQSSGKFLVYNTVSFENANTADGFRCLVGNLFKIFGNLTFFWLQKNFLLLYFSSVFLLQYY